MKTKEELTARITALTMEIQEKYPELSKYLNEMPNTIPADGGSEVDAESLAAYCESLESLMQQYAVEHSAAPGSGPAQSS